MKYVSTRGQCPAVSAEVAILQGLAPDGGLYVPENIPCIDDTFLQSLAPLPYHTRAAKILALFLPDWDGLPALCETAYRRFDGHPAPLTKVAESFPRFLELWHGPTCAFKDMALQILPLLLQKSREMTGETREICILTATSGDTGKAALEGFRDRPGVRVLVFYPRDGVSAVQKLQMITQEGDNVFVCGVDGNFDDAQTGVKNVFEQVKTGVLSIDNVLLSSANSINLGRLLPQIVYYVSACVDAGNPCNFAVPTGNFGNILACWYAKKMGAPVGEILCASNKNNVLTNLLQTGVYDRNRPFYQTLSPSMDILISSNWERALYHLSDGDSTLVRELMHQLQINGRYALPDGMVLPFTAASQDDRATVDCIQSTFAQTGTLIDPHTAVALASVTASVSKDNLADWVVVSTAHPGKFPAAFAASAQQPTLPPNLQGLDQKPQRFTTSVSAAEIPGVVQRFARQ